VEVLDGNIERIADSESALGLKGLYPSLAAFQVSPEVHLPQRGLITKYR